jgi:LysR family glycine cleavage system transcriptional activator
MPLGALRVFEAVAAHLSFSAAAEVLNVTPAAVSQQIKTLESYVQVPLFRRSGRRVEITNEGLELLPAVRAGLDQLGSALQQLKRNRRAGPMQVSLLVSFLQMWLLPRLRFFRRKYPDIELRFHTSRQMVDFSRSETHAAIRFGSGDYPNLHCEKLMDEWLVPVASPELIRQHGTIRFDTDLSRLPLLESDIESWKLWRQPGAQITWRTGAANIDDSAGILAAAEEGLGYALARWTLVSRLLQRGTLRLAGKEVLPFQSAYYFVCPKAFLALPKVANFREWITAAAGDFDQP